MNTNDENKWPKAITVDKRIVRILSSSTYSNFPSAIREIIVNGYDADASRVDVNFDIKNSIITILDNGKGMNDSDFTFYLRIAGKTRKKEERTTKNNRKIIGQFGVGFLSVLPFCEKYLIETTKKGSAEIVTATITSGEYFKEDSVSLDVDRIPINGGVFRDESKMDESYTRIRLVGFSKLTIAYLNREYSIEGKRNTVKNSSPIDLLKWELQEYLPILYNSNDEVGSELNELLAPYSKDKFDVYLNNKKLYRNIHASNILDITKESIQIGDIKFRYFIATDYRTVNPVEARQMLIRNLNVGVGGRTSFGIGIDGRVYAKLAHLTGEILVEEGLNDLISVARDKFNYSVEYEKFKDFFRALLRLHANQLDKIKEVENFIENFQDESKVTDLQNLKDDVISKKIEKLKNSGFELVEDFVKTSKIQNVKSPIEVDKAKMEVHLAITESNIHKRIDVGKQKYRLKVEEWDYKDSDFPAITLDEDLVVINEKYPLFSDKNKVDTFIKLHILLLKSVKNNKINDSAYSSLMSDLLDTFNSQE